MNKKILILFFTAITFIANAQKEFDNWFFGINDGLSFLSGTPVIVTGGALSTNEGCATISTSTGSLLFYTDGKKVYNVNNQQMPNGSGLYGGSSSAQSAIIIPDPADSNLYYIFTVAEMGGANGLCYSKVDMTLQGGLGNITVKNIPLHSPVHEKITAVRQSSGNGYWVIIHDLDSSSTAYYAYPVTSGGIGMPVISSVGLQNTGSVPWQGCMKVSPDGTKLVNPISSLHKVEIADFNSTIGTVSNPFTFDTGTNNYVYGTAFSETGNVLYLTTYLQYPVKLYQLNMAAGSPAAIIASAIIIYTTNDENGSLQLASNHKIYLAHHNSHYLGVINDPDSLGTSCNYVHFSFYLPNTVTYGLENSISGSVQLTDIEQLASSKQDFNVYPNPVNTLCTVYFNADIKNAQLEIFNLVGKEIYKEDFCCTIKKEINLKNIPQGIYFVKVFDGEKNYCKKIIIEHD